MTTFMTHNGFGLTKVKSNNNKNNGTKNEHKNHFGQESNTGPLAPQFKNCYLWVTVLSKPTEFIIRILI